MLQITCPKVWISLRENYAQLFHLFISFNEKMNDAILVSFASNIYFLLTQTYFWMLLNIPYDIVITHFYLFFSVSLLVSRTAFVCFYGASIQEESYNLKKTLVTIPSSIYSKEVMFEFLSIYFYEVKSFLDGEVYRSSAFFSNDFIRK